MKLQLLKDVKYRGKIYAKGEELDVSEPDIAERLVKGGAAAGSGARPAAPSEGAELAALKAKERRAQTDLTNARRQITDLEADLGAATKKAADLETVNEALRAELAKLQAAAEKGASDAK